jgi:hypothetical protein
MPTFWIYQINTGGSFEEAEYIFEFEGKKFRLIRGTDIESDKLTTISDGSKEDDFNCRETAMRLIDYISWQIGVPIQYLGSSTGTGISSKKFNFDNTPINAFHKRILRGRVVRVEKIPKVVNETQKLALSLWNEAEGSNSDFLSFINYWKILELPPHNTKRKGKPNVSAENWINNLSTSNVSGLKDLKDNLSKNRTTDLGKYLYEECRNAIAHVTRKPRLNPSKLEDQNKISSVLLVVRSMAKYYIKSELMLDTHSERLKIFKTKKRTKALRSLKFIYKKPKF